MPLIVPNTVEVEVLTSLLTPALSLKLYSNDYTPVAGSLVGNFTEVAGGGYVAQAFLFAGWTITPGDPSQAVQSVKTFTFTGPTSGPGTIYGYYVVRDSDNKLMWAERFPSGVLPFAPIAGSVVRIVPRFTCQSEF